MEDINEIIIKVFNDDEINEIESNILLKENLELYDCIINNKPLQLEFIDGFNDQLIKRIKDIKTITKCECGQEHSIRYKYRPYLENTDKELCDECIKNYAWDYVALRKLEKNLKLAMEEEYKLERNYNWNLSKVFQTLKLITKEREKIGKWLNEFSLNYLENMDIVSAFFEEIHNVIYIKSYGEKNKKINNLCDIKKFEDQKIIYEDDCENIRLRFEEYSKRPYYFKIINNKYNWIVPKDYSIVIDNEYYGNYENSDIDLISR